MSAPDPRTFNDYIDTLAYHLGGAPDERNQVSVRAAVRNAYRDVALKRAWNYYWAKTRIDLVAPYNTGTIQYTQSTLTVALTGGTFPSWAGNGYAEVRINNIVSRVASSPNSTTLIMDSINNPGQDYAAGQTYQLFQSMYPLPSDWRSMERPVTAPTVYWFGQYVDPQELMELERQGIGVGTFGIPTRWTVTGDPQSMGGRMLWIWPYSNTNQTFDYMYQRFPRPIALTGVRASENQGTVTCPGAPGSSAVVTGVGTAFSQQHVGATFRFGVTQVAGSKAPTGRDGLRPYVEQQTILSVQSPTQLTLATQPVNAYSAATMYLISDPIDYPDFLLSCLERKCEMEIAAKKSRQDFRMAAEEYQTALREAFEADVPVLIARYADSRSAPIRSALKYMPQMFYPNQWS